MPRLGNKARVLRLLAAGLAALGVYSSIRADEVEIGFEFRITRLLMAEG